jgi:hypothetical protein
MLPFIYADTHMAPAGVRAVGSALADSGFAKTRIVLQQWNKNFKPSRMQLDGRVPDLFMVSTMGMHSDCCTELTRDALVIDAKHRPLIIAGGSHAVYEPAFMFNQNPRRPAGPDVAVTGEEFVFLSLLEVLLDVRAPGESLRTAFRRARESGALDDIPGLVYPLASVTESSKNWLIPGPSACSAIWTSCLIPCSGTVCSKRRAAGRRLPPRRWRRRSCGNTARSARS